MNSTTATAGPKRIDRAFLLAGAAVALGVLATYLSQTQVLGLIPLKNLLKNTLGASREATAAFFFWTTMPWYFKPLVGIVQDALPLFGTRRRSYLLVFCLLSSLAWWGLAATPYDYHWFLWVCLGINIMMVVAITAVGGYMVEVAQSSASAGRLSSIRSVVEQLCYVISGPLAGALASIAFAWTAVACGAITFLGVPVALWALRERLLRRQPGEPARVLRAAGGTLVQALHSGPLWLAAAVAFLFYFAPGTNTAQFYAEQNDLHLTTQQQGTIQFLAGCAGIVAALLYGVFGPKHLTLRWLLIICILLGAAGQAAFVLYINWDLARLTAVLNGFGYTLADLALLHLAVRATPKGCEALGFALLMAVRNFGIYGGDWLGSAVQDHWHLSFHALALLNAALSLLAIPLSLLLPAAVVDLRDAQPTPAIDMTPLPHEVKPA